jgi:hypothetical protein
LFAIRNLILIKNFVLVYEIAGSRRASVLDFTDFWNTFAELRARGGFFDLTAYYNMVRNGSLLPKVVENVQDARVELDGLLRKSITRFREHCAETLLKAGNDALKKAEASSKIREKIRVNFPYEEEVRGHLWDATLLLYEDMMKLNKREGVKK